MIPSALFVYSSGLTDTELSNLTSKPISCLYGRRAHRHTAKLPNNPELAYQGESKRCVRAYLTKSHGRDSSPKAPADG